MSAHTDAQQTNPSPSLTPRVSQQSVIRQLQALELSESITWPLSRLETCRNCHSASLKQMHVMQWNQTWASRGIPLSAGWAEGCSVFVSVTCYPQPMMSEATCLMVLSSFCIHPSIPKRVLWHNPKISVNFVNNQFVCSLGLMCWEPFQAKLSWQTLLKHHTVMEMVIFTQVHVTESNYFALFHKNSAWHRSY